MWRTATILGTVTAVLGAVAVFDGASADNQAPNGGFDTNVTGWVRHETVSPGSHATTLAFDPLDATGDADSGSIRVTNIQGNIINPDGQIATLASASFCFDVEPGARVVAFAQARIPGGQSRSGAAVLLLSWYTTPGCLQGTGIVSRFGGDVVSIDAWSSAAVVDSARATARSVRIRLAARKSPADIEGPFAVLFDDVYAGPPATPGVPQAARVPMLAVGP